MTAGDEGGQLKGAQLLEVLHERSHFGAPDVSHECHFHYAELLRHRPSDCFSSSGFALWPAIVLLHIKYRPYGGVLTGPELAAVGVVGPANVGFACQGVACVLCVSGRRYRTFVLQPLRKSATHWSRWFLCPDWRLFVWACYRDYFSHAFPWHRWTQ